MPKGDPAALLAALLAAGLLGALGQGVRAVAGLKKMNDDAANQNASSGDVFIASRLIVSLLIGGLAGIAAGLGLGLATLLSLDKATIDVLLGIAAAGYVGTDFIESFAPTITSKTPPAGARGGQGTQAPATPGAQTQNMQSVAISPGAINPKYGVTFGSLVPDGFFSADPDDLSVRRSIRTNNPGALNFTPWQKTRVGFVGVTQPDNSANHNVTTIYRTPEHGVGAWYHLLAQRYNFPGGRFTLNDLAARYAGSNNAAAIRAYIDGWNRWLVPPIAPSTQISVTDKASLLSLAKGMFSHEAGVATPLHDAQIAFAIEREMAGNLSA